VNALLKGNNEVEDVDIWNGIEDQHTSEFSNQEEEYVDEDRFTTVTVEAIEVSKEGLTNNSNQDEWLEEDKELVKHGGKSDGLKNKWPKKPRKKAFRYETKVERKLTRAKQKAGRSARADSRRSND
jgi:ribosomal RNA-processing protein 17